MHPNARNRARQALRRAAASVTWPRHARPTTTPGRVQRRSLSPQPLRFDAPAFHPCSPRARPGRRRRWSPPRPASASGGWRGAARGRRCPRWKQPARPSPRPCRPSRPPRPAPRPRCPPPFRAARLARPRRRLLLLLRRCAASASRSPKPRCSTRSTSRCSPPTRPRPSPRQRQRRRPRPRARRGTRRPAGRAPPPTQPPLPPPRCSRPPRAGARWRCPRAGCCSARDGLPPGCSRGLRWPVHCSTLRQPGSACCCCPRPSR